MAMSAAQLLDELMGKDRNRAPGEPSSRIHWSDNEMCKFFLCGFCPHELFTNTKADLGICPKEHDEALKKEYEKSSRRGTMGYEESFYRTLLGIMSDVERRIRRGHERLFLNAKKEQDMKAAKGDDEKLSMISDHINQLLNEIETLGSDGKVEEAQGVMKLVEQLKEEKETMVQMKSEEWMDKVIAMKSKLNPLSSQEKQMEVCEICGAFLIVGDAQSRVDDHLQGKQHVGYARIKATVEEMRDGKWRDKLRAEMEAEKTGKVEKEEAEEKREERSKSKDSSTRRERERSRDRNRSREKRDRDRDRDRSRDRNRSREKRDRTRDRSRDRRRERERRRSRSRDRRSRSHSRRSRSRDKRSRSRDRRSRSKDRSRRRGSRERRRSRSRDKSRRRSRSRDRYRRRSRSRDRGDRDRRRSRSRERRRRSRSRSRERRRSRSGSRGSRSHRRSNRASVESDRSEGRRETADEDKKTEDTVDTSKEEDTVNGDTEMKNLSDTNE